MSSPDPEQPVPPPVSTRRTLVGGGAVLILGFGADQFIRFGSNIFLAHLLVPEEFGVLAMCMTFMVGLSLFADLGLRTAIIQSKRGDDPAYLNTAWVIQIIRGFVLWAGAFALAYPAAHWRQEPELRLLWILPTVGFTAVLDGFTSIKLISLLRRMGQRQIVRFDLTCQLFAVGVQVTWAHFDPSVHALVAGILVSSTLRCVGSHILLPGHKSRFAWDRAAAWEFAHFAGWIYVSTACWFLAAQIDKIVVGIRSLAALGVYNFATQIVQMPVALCGAISGRLLFPHYAQLVNGGRDLRDHYLNTHKMAGFLAGFSVTGAAAAGPALALLIYPVSFHAAALFIPLLAVGAFFQILDANGGALLNAKGRVKAYACSHFSKVAVLTVGIPVGFAQAGMEGMIIALIVGDMVRYFVTSILLARNGYHIFRTDVWWVLIAAGVWLGLMLLRDGMREVIPPEKKKTLAGVTLLTSVAGVCVLWLAVYFTGWRVGWLPHYRRR